MESVFVAENPIDINLFVSECNDVQKLKIGEIFQLEDNSLSMCCVLCLQEFQYFTEFSLHTQEHFTQIAQLKEIKEVDSTRSYDQLDTYGKSRVKTEINESEFFDKSLEMEEAWSGGEELAYNNNRNVFEPEINVESLEKLPETPSSIEDSVLCPICSKAFSQLAYARKHVNRTHKLKITADKIRAAQPSFNASFKTVPPVKSDATRSFIEGEDYEKSNGRFRCLICGREMLDHVKEHLMTHSNEKNVMCPVCARAFICESYVRKHCNRAHKIKITAEEIKTAQPSSHTRKQDPNRYDTIVFCQNKIQSCEKNFECYDCHRRFTSLSSLRIHLKLHSGIKYVCPHCEKIFAMRSYVRDHMVAMHGIRRDEIPKDSIVIMDSIRQATGNSTREQRPIDDELFECNLCNTRYRTKQTLRQHMKTHTSSGPFLCVVCGTVYKSYANLKYHMEIHQSDPDKRHTCNECGKTYPTRRYMLSHYRTIHLNKKRKPKNDKINNV